MAENINTNPASPRFKTSETAHIEVYGRMGKLVGHVKNVSKSGASLVLTQGDYIPSEGDVIHVTIHLNSIKRSHFLDAEVKWNQGLSFGVQFVNKDYIVDKMFLKAA